jgi:hypothetical protein
VWVSKSEKQLFIFLNVWKKSFRPDPQRNVGASPVESGLKRRKEGK